MGILDRIKEDHDSKLLTAAGERLAAERATQERVIQLENIIHDVITKLADTLEEDMEVIVSGSVYRVGDIVLYVELFKKYSRSLPDPAQPQKVAMEYLVWLAGLDKRDQKLRKVRIGALKLMRYESLYSTITEAPSYLELGASAVLAHRDQLAALK